MAEAAYTIADVIDTVEAIRRLAADISDEEVESGDDDQHDFVILARTVYRKRELAVSLLYAALCDGALMAAIRLATGMLPIANMEWRTVALWREIIMSGEIQASAGEHLERYNGAPVMLSVAAFEAWLQQRRPRPESVETASPSSTAATGSECSPLTAPAPPTVVTTPEPPVDLVKSGVAGGRPSSLPIVLAEAERRLRNGETKAHFMNHFAEELVAWFKEEQKKHHSLPNISVKTLQNSLDFGSLWMRRDELRAR